MISNTSSCRSTLPAASFRLVSGSEHWIPYGDGLFRTQDLTICTPKRGVRTWISEIPTREGKNMIRLPMAPVALILFALVACSGGDSGQTAGNNGNAWGGGDDLGQGSVGTVSDGDVGWL